MSLTVTWRKICLTAQCETMTYHSHPSLNQSVVYCCTISLPYYHIHTTTFPRTRTVCSADDKKGNIRQVQTTLKHANRGGMHSELQVKRVVVSALQSSTVSLCSQWCACLSGAQTRLSGAQTRLSGAHTYVSATLHTNQLSLSSHKQRSPRTFMLTVSKLLRSVGNIRNHRNISEISTQPNLNPTLIQTLIPTVTQYVQFRTIYSNPETSNHFWSFRSNRDSIPLCVQGCNDFEVWQCSSTHSNVLLTAYN